MYRDDRGHAFQYSQAVGLSRMDEGLGKCSETDNLNILDYIFYIEAEHPKIDTQGTWYHEGLRFEELAVTLYCSELLGYSPNANSLTSVLPLNEIVYWLSKRVYI